MSYLMLGAFFLYHCVLLYYASYVFEFDKTPWRFTVLTGLINTGILYFLLPHLTADFEWILMLCYLLVYGVEFAILSKRDVFVVLFGALAFGLNLFSRRILIMAIFALYYGIDVAQCYENPTLLYLQGIIPFLIAPPYILFTKQYLKKVYLDMLFYDKRNLSFAVSLMGVVYLFLVFVVSTMGATEVGSGFRNFFLLVGCISSLSYHLSLLYSYLFSKLKLHKIRYETVYEHVKEAEADVENLSYQATHDPFTALKLREVAESELAALVASKSACHIVFVDMDGLKTVNDEYGHSEGDFYIRCVADILRDCFPEETIARLGGDEFLIIGRGADHYATLSHTLQAYARVGDIQKQYNTSYETSISYGLVHVPRNNQKSVTTLIDEADAKM